MAFTSTAHGGTHLDGHHQYDLLGAQVIEEVAAQADVDGNFIRYKGEQVNEKYGDAGHCRYQKQETSASDKTQAHDGNAAQECPHLVNMIESGVSRDDLRRAIDGFVADMLFQLAGRRPDAVMLGCTHYPLVEHLFRAALPAATRIVSQPRRTAEALTAYLFRHPEMKSFGAGPVPPRLFTSGDPEHVSQLASTFLAGHLGDGQAIFESLPHHITGLRQYA